MPSGHFTHVHKFLQAKGMVDLNLSRTCTNLLDTLLETLDKTVFNGGKVYTSNAGTEFVCFSEVMYASPSLVVTPETVGNTPGNFYT
jgi:hypothetical protein